MVVQLLRTSGIVVGRKTVIATDVDRRDFSFIFFFVEGLFCGTDCVISVELFKRERHKCLTVKFSKLLKRNLRNFSLN